MTSITISEISGLRVSRDSGVFHAEQTSPADAPREITPKSTVARGRPMSLIAVGGAFPGELS